MENPCLYEWQYITVVQEEANMLKHLTTPRLAAVESFFRTKSNRDSLGCHAWNQAVGAALLPILGDFEIALRNALHRALSQHYGNVDSHNWMMPQPNPVHAINPAAPGMLPAKHKMTQRSRDDVITVVGKIKRKKLTGYLVTPDDVVAALPFGFWEVLIGGLSHKSQPTGLQAMILAAVFPYAPDIHSVPYADAAFKQRVTNLLTRIRDVRNRIVHHDSLWSMPEFSRMGIVGFIPRRPRHTVKSIQLFIDNVCWFACWIDPDIAIYIRMSDHWWLLHASLQRQVLATYREMEGRVGTCRAILNATNLPERGKYKPLKSRSKHIQRLLLGRHFF